MLDLLISYSFVKPGSVNGKTVGILGTITSLIGIYQLWAWWVIHINFALYFKIDNAFLNNSDNIVSIKLYSKLCEANLTNISILYNYIKRRNIDLMGASYNFCPGNHKGPEGLNIGFS